MKYAEPFIGREVRIGATLARMDAQARSRRRGTGDAQNVEDALTALLHYAEATRPGSSGELLARVRENIEVEVLRERPL